MSYIKIWVHCVWTTKKRILYLKGEILEIVISHILENAQLKDIYIDQLSGYWDHLHALISMGGKQNISDIMQKIKGESSYWINKNKISMGRFEWQDDFYAVSVGSSELDRVRKYIRSQVNHHKKVSLQEELNKLIEEYNLKRIGD